MYVNWIKRWQTVFILFVLLFEYPAASYAQDPSIVSIDDNRVTEILNKAEQAFARDRLTTPEEDNALAYIEQALAIAPNNPRAIMLLKRIAKRYGELINNTLEKYHSLQHTNTRDLAREVIISHVKLGELALDRGKIAKARRHVKIAGELALEYGIEEEDLKRLSLRITQSEWWPNALHKLRILGTF